MLCCRADRPVTPKSGLPAQIGLLRHLPRLSWHRLERDAARVSDGGTTGHGGIYGNDAQPNTGKFGEMIDMLCSDQVLRMSANSMVFE